MVEVNENNWKTLLILLCEVVVGRKIYYYIKMESKEEKGNTYFSYNLHLDMDIAKFLQDGR